MMCTILKADLRASFTALQLPIPDDEFVLHSVIGSLCARLQIDPAKFGLDLG
jgi:hypothetical protein